MIPVGTSSEEEEAFIKECLLDVASGSHDHARAKRHNDVSSLSDSCPSTRHQPVSKAFKADVRHTIPQLFEEGMNSADPTKMQQIVSTIMLADTDMDVFRLDHNQRSDEHHEATLLGRSQIWDHFARLMLAIPDLVFLIHEWKIFPRSHQHSCLVFQFSLTGQQLYPLKSPCTALDDENTRGYHRWLVHPPPPHYAEATGSNHSSVLFREGGAKYDSRRKNKFHTIGEYVDIHQLPPAVEAPDAVSAAATVVGGRDSPCTSMPSESSRSHAAHSLDEEFVEEPAGPGFVQDIVRTRDENDDAARKADNSTIEQPVVVVQHGKHVSVRGMMRFHFNAEHLVYKVHCVHMHDMQ